MSDEEESMSLPKDAILDFQKLYEHVCGEKISYEKAVTESINLLRLFDLISRNTVREMKNEKEFHHRAK